MENKNYVVNGVGFGALFKAMVAQARVDIAKFEAMKNEIEKRDGTVCAEFDAREALRLARAEALANEACEGINEWVTVLRKLDIADTIIE